MSPGSLRELIAAIENQTGLFFSFNPQQIPQDEEILLSKNSYELNEILEEIKRVFKLDYRIDLSTRKIFLRPLTEIEVSGFIVDKLSGERIAGAVLISEGKYLGSSNSTGFFTIALEIPEMNFEVYNIAYEPNIIELGDTSKDSLVIYLNPRLDVNVIITPEEQRIFGLENITLDDINRHYGIAGSNDLIQAVKFRSGVSNGAEGQNGYTTRGGGPHQNLILIDGIPIYESSHLGGLSSIFLSEAIKKAELYNSEFPSRYGGRVASVLDVSLREGSRNNFNRTLSMGFEGATLHIDGPLNENTSININGRKTWISQLASPIVTRFTDVEKLDLSYGDIYGKLSHWFSNTNNLSVSAYLGDDLVKIIRNNQNANMLGFRDLNRISWGNRLVTANWNVLLSKNIHFELQAGRSTYNYRSRGTYDFNFNLQDSVANRAFDILSISRIQESVLKSRIEYYSKNSGTWSLGIQFTGHENEPSVRESERYAPDNPEPNIVDTLYNAQEWNAYLEQNWTPNKYLRFRNGVRMSHYRAGDGKYFFFEPRLSASLMLKNQVFSLAYSRISQFTHLLSNPGPGLPSELWVPSTELLPPEISNLYSVSYDYAQDGFEAGLVTWYRNFNNLVEYENPSDLIYSIIINNQLYQVEVDNRQWEARTSLGSGYAYGFDLALRKNMQPFDLALNYSYARSFREFDAIDEGEVFPYKYDSPHNISTYLQYDLGNDNSLSINWQFSSGTAYSLSDTERLGADGMPVLVPSSRNNFRLPDFHHLDIHYSKTITLENGKLAWDFGVYNVYNRLNAFYEYLSQNSESGASELVKISIYPILPQFKISYSW